MQAEKYLFHLSKWEKNGEDDSQRRKRSELPTGLKIKISNPKAMLIYGRDNEFDEQQKLDFEIIRRKYADMMDIINYDDLLRRIENILSRFSYPSSPLISNFLAEIVDGYEFFAVLIVPIGPAIAARCALGGGAHFMNGAGQFASRGSVFFRPQFH